MAPPKITTVRKQNKNSAGNLQQFYVKYVNLKYAKYLFFDPNALSIVTALILLTELFLNLIVILRVPYTEIDWKAYMQECEGFLNGTTNYALLRGKLIFYFSISILILAIFGFMHTYHLATFQQHEPPLNYFYK